MALEWNPIEADKVADEAEAELTHTFTDEEIARFGKWIEKYYLRCGYKRLCRPIIARSKGGKS